MLLLVPGSDYGPPSLTHWYCWRILITHPGHYFVITTRSSVVSVKPPYLD